MAWPSAGEWDLTLQTYSAPGEEAAGMKRDGWLGGMAQQRARNGTIKDSGGGRGEVGWVGAGWVVSEGQDLIASLSDLST